MKDIQDVEDRYQFGIELGIPKRHLDNIQLIYGEDKLNVLKGIIIKWIILDAYASWSKLLSALIRIGHNELADIISTKYLVGKPIYSLVEFYYDLS